MALFGHHMIAKKCQHYDHFLSEQWETPTISNVSDWGRWCRVAIKHGPAFGDFSPRLFREIHGVAGRGARRMEPEPKSRCPRSSGGGYGHFHGYHLHNYMGVSENVVYP